MSYDPKFDEEPDFVTNEIKWIDLAIYFVLLIAIALLIVAVLVYASIVFWYLIVPGAMIYFAVRLIIKSVLKR